MKFSKTFLYITLFILFFSILGIFKIKPDLASWKYPLSPDSHNHHHTIIKVIYETHSNPDFLKKDMVVQAIKKHYHIFYKQILLFFTYGLGFSLNSTVNLSIILSILLTFIGVFLLSYNLFKNFWSGILSSIMILLIPSDIFLIDSVTNWPRMISNGICLISLAYFFKREYRMSLTICALATLFHYGMPIYLILIYSVYFIFRIKTFPFVQIITAYIIFISIFAIINYPLILSILKTTRIEYNLLDWKTIIKETAPFWSYTTINPLKILIGFIPLILIPIFVKIYFSAHFKDFFYFVIAFIAIQIFHFFIYDVVFIPFFARMIIFNAQYFIPYIFVIVISGSIIKAMSLEEKEILFPLNGIFLVSILFFIKWSIPTIHYAHYKICDTVFYIIAAIMLYDMSFRKGKFEKLFNQYLQKHNYRVQIQKLLLSFIIVVAAGFYFLTIAKKVDFTEKSILKFQNESWYQTQIWIKNNTIIGDVFILPQKPIFLFGLQIYAERANFCSKVYDAHLVALLAPEYTSQIVKELTFLWSSEEGKKMAKNFSQIKSIVQFSEKHFLYNRAESLKNLAKFYPNVKYLITQIDTIINLPIVYKNLKYIIYKVN